MPLRTLDPRQVTRLRAQPFTYADVGASAGETAPAGYHWFSRTRLLPPGCGFDEAIGRLLSWEVQERAGLNVAASSLTVAEGEVVVMRLGVGRLALTASCRVVRVIDEPDRSGFAYGTLPGHPESGEEAFVLRRRADGRTEFTVSAFSRPASALARLGGPVSRGAQSLMTRRYLRTLDH